MVAKTAGVIIYCTGAHKRLSNPGLGTRFCALNENEVTVTAIKMLSAFFMIFVFFSWAGVFNNGRYAIRSSDSKNNHGGTATRRVTYLFPASTRRRSKSRCDLMCSANVLANNITK